MSYRFARLALLGVLLSTLAACAGKSINDVLADPSRYRDREVTVRGVVNESFSLAGRGAYQIEDRTGSLWVLSDRGVPRRGARVEAKGTIREAFNLGPFTERIGRTLSGVVMVEHSHKADAR